jgi:hypothetical protein
LKLARGVHAGTSRAQVNDQVLRRLAYSEGLHLEKSRRRNPQAAGYGTYQLTDSQTGKIVAGDASGYGLSLEDSITTTGR